MVYVGRYRDVAFIAYGSLFVATAAQLVVPQLVEGIIDTLVAGFTGGDVSGVAKVIVQSPLARGSSAGALVLAMVAIVIFAAFRAVFAFLQGYNAEKISQNIAFDFRNELFAKIQRLSFSYHDRNQTGQLMIRATDDVEKVRLFLGQGLVMALQAYVLLIATLVVLWLTNHTLTLVIIPILPIAFLVFLGFGAISQPLFMQVQIRISALNTVLQENVAGLKVVRAFAREPHEQARFAKSADDLLAQQLRVSRVFSFLFPLIFLMQKPKHAQGGADVAVH